MIRHRDVIINTGTHTVTDAIPGLAEAQPLTHTEALELDELPEHLFVIGGYIGLELAQATRRFGTKLTVLDRNDRLIHREDEDASEALQQLFHDDGIDFVLNAKVRRVSGNSEQSVTLVIEQGGIAYCMFTGPGLAHIGLSEKEAKERGIAHRLFKIPMAAVVRATTLSETRGFLKALVEVNTDRILGFTGFGVDVGEILSSVQIAMPAGLPYTTLCDGALTHPTLVEELIPLFSSAPSTHNVAETKQASTVRQQTTTA